LVPDEVAAFANRGGELVPASAYFFPNPSAPDSLPQPWPCAEIELGLVLCLGSVLAALCCRLHTKRQTTHSIRPAQPRSPGAVVPVPGLTTFLKEHLGLGEGGIGQNTRGKVGSLD